MIQNYLIVAFRNFLRNKRYTIINIIGLSVGLTACIIIYLLISYDLKFDKFHTKGDRIYRVLRETQTASGIQSEAITPYPFANAFRQDFPDIPLVTQFHFEEEGFISFGTEKLKIEDILFADTAFFKVFDFNVVDGNPLKDLAVPNKVFLTKSLAKKLHLGVNDKLKLDNKLELEVAGVLQDVPAHSHIQYSMIISMPSFTEEFFEWPVDRWGLNSAGFSYIVIPEDISPENILTRFKGFVSKYYGEDDKDRTRFLLQSLHSIHFDTRHTKTPGHVSNVDGSSLVVLGVLGLFIIIIASINFINMATALAAKKSKEIGIRKTLGAKRIQLTTYFLGETLLLILFAVVISLGLVEWILPWLRNFTEKEIYLNLLSNPALILFLLVLVLFATLFSGFYPAVILSGFDPAAVLKNKITAQGSSGSFVRRLLVIFQFVIAQVMIIGTLVITDQMDYFNSKPLGFNYKAVLNVPLRQNDKNLLDNFRSRLESNPNVEQVSFAVGAPTSGNSIGTGFFLEEKGSDENYTVEIKTVDLHYKDTYGLNIKAGRWFQESEEKRATDTTLEESARFVFVLNEAAVRKLGFSNAEEVIGKRIHVGLNDVMAPVIGVTEDFHTSSLREEVGPTVMMIYPDFYYDAGIAISTTDMSGTINFIKKNWTDLFPEYLFEYEFLDQHLESLYRAEQRQLTLFRIFSAVSIFIGCLGLLGLVSFMANQKVKEIGVRKVFGASVTSILLIFSKEFARLVLIAFLLAAPLSWYLMNKWLEGFEYHIKIHWTTFAIGLIVTLAIALLTVSYRSVKAGFTNPVNSLRSE